MNTKEIVAKLSDRQRMRLESYKRELTKSIIESELAEEKRIRAKILGYTNALVDTKVFSDVESRAILTYYTLI